jgi:hypothetical protein
LVAVLCAYLERAPPPLSPLSLPLIIADDDDDDEDDE